MFNLLTWFLYANKSQSGIHLVHAPMLDCADRYSRPDIGLCLGLRQQSGINFDYVVDRNLSQANQKAVFAQNGRKQKRSNLEPCRGEG